MNLVPFGFLKQQNQGITTLNDAALGTLKFWYDFDVGVTHEPYAGDEIITAIADQSGNGINLTEVLSGVNFRSNMLNGHAGGSSIISKGDLQSASALDAFTEATIYVVGTFETETSAEGAGSMISCVDRYGGFDEGFLILNYNEDQTHPYVTINTAAGSPLWPVSNTISLGTFYTFRLRFDGTNGYFSINNGTEISKAKSSTTIAPNKLDLFSMHNHGDSAGRFQMVDVVGYYTNHNSTQRDAVSNILQTRFAHY